MGADMTGAQSLRVTTDELADKWTGYYRFEIGSELEYAAYMEYGTRPHVITPNSANALHFWVDGVEVFTTHVEHPGTEPRPFMRPAAEAAHRQAPSAVLGSDDLEDVAEALSEIVQTVAKRLAPRDEGTLAASIQIWQVS